MRPHHFPPLDTALGAQLTVLEEIQAGRVAA